MKISFDCFKCGKCCTSGPALSIAEAFKYQDIFIVGIRYQAQHFNKLQKTPIAIDLGGKPLTSAELKVFKDHLEMLSPVVRTADAEFYLNIFPGVFGYSEVNGNRCEALDEDGSCRLHADKPAMCRSVPFDTIMPEMAQAHALRRFKDYGCVKEGETADSQAIIFENGSITNDEYLAAFNRRLADWDADTPYITTLASLMKDESPLMPSMRSLMAVAEQGGWNETDMSPLLFAMALTSWDKKPLIDNFIQAQTSLIKAEIDKALARKNKNERERTRILRNYLDAYQRTADFLNDPKFPGRPQ